MVLGEYRLQSLIVVGLRKQGNRKAGATSGRLLEVNAGAFW